LGILVMVALACSGGVAVARATTSVGGNAVNLVATPAVKAALRRAFCRHVTSGPCPRGPLKTAKLRTYYGRVGVNEYAVAYFDVIADQPEWFSRRVRGTWRDRGDTGGGSLRADPMVASGGRLALPLFKLGTGPAHRALVQVLRAALERFAEVAALVLSVGDGLSPQNRRPISG
jgi:hypothetical protein